MSLKDLKSTAEKGKGSTPRVRHITSSGTQIRVPGQISGGKKGPGMTKEAARGLGIKRK